MFKKFPSIESFAHVVRGQARFEVPAKVRYGAKIKLHGTNAGVRIEPDGTVHAQSRSRDITPQQDNAGFAAWLEPNKEEWANADLPAGTVTFFGEWAGKGIQKGDAVCQLNDKYFFIFAMQIDNDLITDPRWIEQTIPDLDDVLVLPWDCIWDNEIDYADPSVCVPFSELLEEKVKSIGEQDPFIHGIFGVDGPGEGLVVVPITDLTGEDATLGISRELYSELTFKVKTEAHSVKKGKVAPVQIEVPAGVLEFVDMFVTEARCQQGLVEACDGTAEPRNTGNFLKWMGQDIKKESVAELEDAGLEWKDVTKHVTDASKSWWLAKCKEI